MTTKAMQVTALVLEGKIDEAVKIAGMTDAASQALRDAGFTAYGRPVRPPCPCWFYERAPWTHDQFLDLPDLPPKVGWSLILELTCLDSNRPRWLTEEPMFLAPEEIGTFVYIHNLPLESVAQSMRRLAEQARWGRAGGHKMAMVHNVPGLDPDYRDSFASEVAS
jgi:hypothetical protein